MSLEEKEKTNQSSTFLEEKKIERTNEIWKKKKRIISHMYN